MGIEGYIAFALIGILLGLVGGGGSILTVPALVYLFGMQPLASTSYSLFVVGSTSLIGAINNYHKGGVSIKTAMLFGASSAATVFVTRKLIIPRIPPNIATIGTFTLTESFVTMVLFALLMIVAAFYMIKNGKKEQTGTPDHSEIRLANILLYGAVIGLITGLLGAGGGFLLIPALVLVMHMPMKKAVGTSLLIIALNSLVGFVGDIGHFTIDWTFLTTISLIAIAGVFTGGWIGKKIAAGKLKKGFGWFVLAMGIYIILKETVGL